MTRLLLLAVLVPSVALADPGIAVKRPVPPGPYIVEYDCFHSNMPFAKGSQSRTRRFDLAAKTETSQSIVDEGDVMPKPKAPPVKPTVVRLTDARVKKLATAVDAVLAGGPYAPEYPVPEGVSCKVVIRATQSKALVDVFAIDKAYTKQRDAVSTLVDAFAP